jgi:hypothetical protein
MWVAQPYCIWLTDQAKEDEIPGYVSLSQHAALVHKLEKGEELIWLFR